MRTPAVLYQISKTDPRHTSRGTGCRVCKVDSKVGRREQVWGALPTLHMPLLVAGQPAGAYDRWPACSSFSSSLVVFDHRPTGCPPSLTMTLVLMAMKITKSRALRDSTPGHPTPNIPYDCNVSSPRTSMKYLAPEDSPSLNHPRLLWLLGCTSLRLCCWP